MCANTCLVCDNMQSHLFVLKDFFSSIVEVVISGKDHSKLGILYYFQVSSLVVVLLESALASSGTTAFLQPTVGNL